MCCHRQSPFVLVQLPKLAQSVGLNLGKIRILRLSCQSVWFYLNELSPHPENRSRSTAHLSDDFPDALALSLLRWGVMYYSPTL